MALQSGHYKRLAVFDISSGGISGAHLLVEHTNATTGSDKKATVFSQGHLLTKTTLEKDVDAFIKEHTSLIGELAKMLSIAAPHKVDHLQLVLSSPWFASQTRHITYKKTVPFVCTQKLIDSLVEKEVEFILKNDMAAFGVVATEGRVIEKQISHIRLNEYTVHNPIGKKALSLDLFVVVTISPKMVIEQFESALRHQYGNRVPLTITTGPYATAIVARDYLGAHPDTLVVDIGERVTDVGFIKEGIFLYNYSFPMGMFSLYTQLPGMGTEQLAEPRALIEAYRAKKLAPSEEGRIQEVLKAFGTSWKNEFEHSLQAEQYGVSFPHQIFLTGDYRFAFFFKEILETASYLQHMSTAQTISSTFITQEACHDFIASADGQPIDSPIVVAGLFAIRRLS